MINNLKKRRQKPQKHLIGPIQSKKSSQPLDKNPIKTPKPQATLMKGTRTV